MKAYKAYVVMPLLANVGWLVPIYLTVSGAGEVSLEGWLFMALALGTLTLIVFLIGLKIERDKERIIRDIISRRR